ncbi:ABC transporter permease [Lacinutrix sp. Bg11-31]|nr:ABC transporter permease [Lacinutrix sp. Bg11-31]
MQLKNYFKLQLRILNRRLIDFGLPLFIAYLLFPVFFVLLSNFLFSKTEFSKIIYILISLVFIAKLSEKRRNDFIKSILNKTNYLKLRIIENLILALPFLAYLTFKQLIFHALLLTVLAALLAFVNFNSKLNLTIPTPFKKKPFEFTVGFRKTFYIFPIAYFLTYKAISVGNFNLGLFSMLLISFVCLSYYSKLENDYFIWNYNLTPKAFLLEKLKTCFIYFTFLNVPIVLTLCFSFNKEIDIIIILSLLCYSFLATIIFAKYSNIPNEINLPEGIIIAFCFIFPPALVITIPYFYSKSIKRLNHLLE